MSIHVPEQGKLRLRTRQAACARRLCTSAAFLMFGLAGCSDIEPRPPVKMDGPVYWSIRASYQAVQLSLRDPYDTLQLAAVPIGIDGRLLDTLALTEAVKTQWISRDSSKVRVSSTGRLTALREADGVLVIVKHTIGRLTYTDTVLVRVKDAADPPVLDTFSIQPDDSLKRAAVNFLPYMWTRYLRAVDSDGNPMSGIPVRWKTSDPKLATITGGFSSPGLLSIMRGDSILITASTWVYGVAKSDSVMLQIGYPVSIPYPSTEAIQVATSASTIAIVPLERRVRIGPGGVAMFQNNSGFGPKDGRGGRPLDAVPIDIIFDDSTVALGYPIGAGGNIRGIPGDTTVKARSQLRRFVTPGEHFYTIQPHGVRGSIYVHYK